MQRINEFVRMYLQRLDERAYNSHSPQQVVLGTLILWLGWLCFNSGSCLSITENQENAQVAIVNTILAPSAGGITIFFFNYYQNSKLQDNSRVRLNFSLITNGILAGLVSITAGCNDVKEWAAILIGATGAFIYLLAVWLLEKMKVDDPLHATQVHGFCGLWGILSLPFFSKTKGLLHGHGAGGMFLLHQLIGAVVIITWVGLISFLFFFFMNKFGWLRMDDKDEVLGGDIYYFAPI